MIQKLDCFYQIQSNSASQMGNLFKDSPKYIKINFFLYLSLKLHNQLLGCVQTKQHSQVKSFLN